MSTSEKIKFLRRYYLLFKKKGSPNYLLFKKKGSPNHFANFQNIFLIEFQSMRFVSNDCVFYYQTKTIINFWCRQELNFRHLIQPLETLLIKLNL